MAVVNYNQITKGLSGKFGEDIVFRQFGKRTIFGARPRKSLVVSDRMKAHRERFKLATVYAKTKMLDPNTKAEYEAMARQQEIASAFAAAVGDFIKSPEIQSVSAEGYTGQVAAPIRVLALNNYKITGVAIAITLADGTPVESGSATLVPETGSWTYLTTVNNPSLPGTKVIATATDRPGNVTTLEIVL